MSPNQNPWSIIIKSAGVLSLLIYLSACSSGGSDDDDSSGNGTGSSSKPKDTYFSLAITENSHNHVGARLLFLDFQGTTATPSSQNNIVVAQKVNSNYINLNGDASDWAQLPLTTVKGLPQNNYPLSEFYDAVPTDITVGSAWDGTYVYFLVQWQDANNDGSTEYKKWVYSGGQWITKSHVKTSNTNVINSGDTLLGKENEDRVLMMFPIIDNEGNFAALDSKSRHGLGCAAYCHPNLIDDDASQNYTGTDIEGNPTVKMHTNQGSDVADIWHWKSTRTMPSGYADDKYLDNNSTAPSGGRQDDDGTAAYADNVLSGGNPTYISAANNSSNGITDNSDILQSNSTKLYDVDNDATLSGGEEVPSVISQAPDGSRADVMAVSSFINGTWTVEFKRRLTTNDTAHDHQFTAGTNATAPQYEAIMAGEPGDGTGSTGDPDGDVIFLEICDTCHSTDGIGDHFGSLTDWTYPRNQRASGSLIMKTLITAEDAGFGNHDMWEELAKLNAYKSTYNLSIDIEQMVENLAAFLQEQHEAPVP